MYKIIIIISAAFITLCCTISKDTSPGSPEQKNPSVDGIRIAWDHSTLRRLSRADANYAGYARMIRLHNGTLVCVYESDGNIECVRSNGDINNWSKPAVIALMENQVARCVPDILEKNDGTLLLSYNLRPQGNNTDTSKRFSIRVKHSNDGGISWQHETEIYRAGYEFKNGCWEPSQVQLPSGEIQLFIANEAPYTSSDEQEITVFRSTNGGFNWSGGETASFRKGFRDGMPVPLVIENTNEIIFSIEDNGIAPPQFKPVIIRAAINEKKKVAVSGDDENRAYALDNFNIIPPEKYAGAPYLRRLNSGEVLLSYQGNELRTKDQWDLSDMIVCIGDNTGRNFNRKSLPFYTNDPTKTCLWNSITVESDSTVIALGSTNAYGVKTSVYMVRGYILKDISSPSNHLNIDGEPDEPLYNLPRQVFIGGYGSSYAEIWSCWNDKNFYAAVLVKDSSIHTSTNNSNLGDRISISLDPFNGSSSSPQKGNYAIDVSAAGKLLIYEGDNGQWKNRKAEGIIYSVKPYDGGYCVEVSVPWTILGGIPPVNSRIGFNAVLNEVSADSKFNYSECINGNEEDKPFTWSTLKLKK